MIHIITNTVMQTIRLLTIPMPTDIRMDSIPFILHIHIPSLLHRVCFSFFQPFLYASISRRQRDHLLDERSSAC